MRASWLSDQAKYALRAYGVIVTCSTDDTSCMPNWHSLERLCNSCMSVFCVLIVDRGISAITVSTFLQNTRGKRGTSCGMMSTIVSFLTAQRDRFFQGLSAIIFYLILATGALFIFGPLIFYILYRFCHFIWPLGAVYLTWVYFVDLETFSRGGRRMEFVRNNIFFRYLRDYFPVTLVKTSELDPSRNYIFGYHPHGMFPDGLALSFGSEALQFSKTFPGIVPYIGVHSCMLSIFWFFSSILVTIALNSLILRRSRVGCVTHCLFPFVYETNDVDNLRIRLHREGKSRLQGLLAFSSLVLFRINRENVQKSTGKTTALWEHPL